MSPRLAIVTGGVGTLGQATAKALIDDGWSVALLDVADEVESIAADFGANGFACDITDPASRAVALDRIDERLGAASALVNCAGIGVLKPVFELDEALWARTMDVNVTAPLFLTQAVARRMAPLGRGTIVNIASVSGMRAGFGRTAYGTSKAALIHLTRQLAVELAPFGITCNAVAPGPVEGPLAASGHSKETVAEYCASVPQARYGKPQEVADVIAFLCSPAARHMTGQTLAVDGGWTAGGVGVAEARMVALPD